jgi:hypothetical protein
LLEVITATPDPFFRCANQYRTVLGRQHQTAQGIYPKYRQKQGKKEENFYSSILYFNIFKI